MVLVHCTLLNDIYQPKKFQVDTSCSLGVMVLTRFKYENKQRAIVKKIHKVE